MGEAGSTAPETGRLLLGQRAACSSSTGPGKLQEDEHGHGSEQEELSLFQLPSYLWEVSTLQTQSASHWGKPEQEVRKPGLTATPL